MQLKKLGLKNVESKVDTAGYISLKIFNDV